MDDVNASAIVSKAASDAATPEDLERFLTAFHTDREAYIVALEGLDGVSLWRLMWNATRAPGSLPGRIVETLGASGAKVAFDLLRDKFGTLMTFAPETLPSLVQGLRQSGLEEAFAPTVTQWIEHYFDEDDLESAYKDGAHRFGEEAGIRHLADALAETVRGVESEPFREALHAGIERGARRLDNSTMRWAAGILESQLRNALR